MTGVSLAAALAVAAFGRDGLARKRIFIDDDFATGPALGFDGPAIGGRTAPDATAPAYLAGGPLATVGDRALVIDADSGELVLADATGAARARLSIGPTAAQLVYDDQARRAYVADRAGDRIVMVDVGDQLTVAGSFSTATEPFGLALAPDRARLYVTTVADRTLTAYDPATGTAAWSIPLAREPRGVAVSPDGARAAVGYLATGTIELVDLADHGGHHVALGTGPVPRGGRAGAQRSSVGDGAQPTGRTFARNAFAVRFIGHGLAVAAHQVSTPVQDLARRENPGSYGGGVAPPIAHRLAFVAGDDSQIGATIDAHQPQAMAWDARTDTLYVAGYGSDDVLVVDHASQADARLGRSTRITPAKAPCGPTGLAIADDGAVVVWCGLSRTLARGTRSAEALTVAALGDAPLTRSGLSKAQHRGAELFRAANDARLSSRGALACASCHPEGRDDGLSWRIERHELQTPLLAGKIEHTGPFKWDGSDKDLTTSLSSTMRRLGGAGLPAADTRALAAYLTALPPPRTPQRTPAAVARGKALFDGELGCATCHGGAARTDGERHQFGSPSLPDVDTPALVGVAASAPYFHDGSAATLEAVLLDNGLVHGMAETASLPDSQIADLVAYLESI